MAIKTKLFAMFFNKNILNILFVIGAIFLGKYLLWTNINIVIFVLFVWIIINPISSRVLASLSLIFLIIVPIFLVFFHDKERADRFAIYAYYFLIMSVIMGIYELKKDSDQKKI